MKSRSVFMLSGATVAVLLAAMLVMAQSEPAGAAKDQCWDAVTNLYSDCDLSLSVGDYDLPSFSDAVSFCRVESDTSQRACWTNCALDYPDCGEMASCIDECFDGATHCGFLIQILYDNCPIALKNPDTGVELSRDEALAACNAAESAGSQLFDCVTTCAYNNYDDCQGIYDCLKICYAGGTPPDDDADDDNAGDNSAAGSHGQELNDTGGSACGI
jgi:hypothetical protein